MRRSITLVSALTCFSLFAACKDEAPKNVAAPSDGRPALAAKQAATDVSTLSERDGLFALVPAEAQAFFFWDLSGPAFERLLQSRWGKSYLTRTENISSQLPELSAALKTAGLPLDNPEELRQKIRESLVFLKKDDLDEASGGLILRTVKADGGAAVLDSLRNAAKKDSLIEDLAGGAFSFDITIPSSPTNTAGKKRRLVASASGDKVLVSDKQETLADLAKATPFDVKTIGNLGATTESAMDRIAVGYLNVKGLQGAGSTPLTGAFMSVRMTDRPVVSIRVKKANGGTLPIKETPKALLSAFPNNPILFATIQAGELRELAENNSEQARGVMSDTQFAPLKSIRQLSVAMRSGAEAQAMLPIPEVIVAAETDTPAAVSKAMISAAVDAIKGYGIPVQPTDKKIMGRMVKIVPGVFGLSLNVVELDGAVIASTSEELISNAIERAASKDPLSGLTISATALSGMKEIGLGKLYLSFPEVSKLLESAKGMASLGGAQSAPESLNSLLSPENLKALNDLGVLFSSVKQEDDLVLGEITYL